MQRNVKSISHPADGQHFHCEPKSIHALDGQSERMRHGDKAGALRRVKMHKLGIQGSAIRWSLGCMNAAGEARQKWQATAATKLTKPGDCLLAEPCTLRNFGLSGKSAAPRLCESRCCLQSTQPSLCFLDPLSSDILIIRPTGKKRIKRIETFENVVCLDVPFPNFARPRDGIGDREGN